ncbi:MAG TPA: alpha/beta hydrolase [Kofleriaceae bacterium]|jgi:pimeloyl-ACP methyl ester carboxylesterase
MSRFAELGGRFESARLARAKIPGIGARDAERGYQRLGLRHADVRVRIAGSGPRTIVIVPDPPNTIEHYDALVELLAPHARVVLFEVPGFGLSFPRTSTFGFSAAHFSDVLVEVIEALSLSHVTLVMSCIGGYVALATARARPELVARLVLAQTPAHRDMVAWARRFDRLGILGLPVVGQALMWLVKTRATRFWYENALPAGANAAPFAAPALAAQALGGPYALASGIQAMRALDLAIIAGVEQPVTIAWGHADRTHASTDPRGLVEVVPHADFHSFTQSGHFPDLEDPERFAALVLVS